MSDSQVFAKGRIKPAENDRARQKQIAQILAKVKNQTLTPNEGYRLLNKLRNESLAIAQDEASLVQEPQPASSATEDIAIIGISGRFPDADDVETFWENLQQGKHSVGELPTSRRNLAGFYNPHCKTADTSRTWGGFLEGIENFDPLFFNISPKEAEWIEPQQRLMLQETWKALENAGYAPADIEEKKCGVFIGGKRGDYIDQLPRSVNAYSLTSKSFSVLAARISYYLNLQGPCFPVDTACSSALVATALACESLRAGTSDVAIVGGVSLMTSPTAHQVLNKTGMLSPDGTCRTFDDRANGIVPGEAVGVIILKPLKTAILDRDYVHGVIKGYGINHDGRTNGMTAPNGRSQTALHREVYERFAINPNSIGYVEAHGTATQLGDPIEVQALCDAFASYDVPEANCAIGSVKTNIGHTLEASGMASLIKVLMCLQHRKLVPSLHLKRLNQHIQWAGSPFYVNTELKDWPDSNQPRRAATSAFGMSGTNCHLVLEEAPPQKSVASNHRYHLIPLSAKTEQALRVRISQMVRWLTQHKASFSLADIAYTLSVGRTHFRYRTAFVVSSKEDLEDQLQQFGSEGRCDENPHTGQTGASDRSLDADPELAKLQELARRYIAGAELDTGCLYSSESRYRIPLPTYPFTGDAFWIPADEDKTPTAGKEGAAWLHPLIERNTSTFAAHQYTTRFSLNDFFLADHRLFSESILPGVIAIEMARAAEKLAAGQFKVIRNLVWTRSVTLKSENISQGVEVTITLTPHPDTIGFNLAFSDEEGCEQIYAQGKLTSTGGSNAIQELADLSAIRSRCQQRQDAADLYQRVRAAGFYHGPRLQAMREIFLSENEVLARLELPFSLEQDFDRYDFHPALMDGALQTVIGLLLSSNSKQALYLPYAVGEVKLLHPLTRKCYAHATFASGEGAGIQKFNIRLLNDEGLPLVVMNDVVLREHGIGNLPPEQKEPEYLLAGPVWEPRPLVPISSTKPTRLLVFAEDTSLLEAFTSSCHAEVFLVKPGSTFSESASMYEIDPAKEDHYQRLVESLERRNSLPQDIIHFWSCESFCEEEVLLKAQLNRSLYSIFFLCRALAVTDQVPAPVKRNLLYMYSVRAGEYAPHHAAMASWCAAMQLEHPYLRCKTVELNCEANLTFALPWLSQWLLSELHSDGDKEEMKGVSRSSMIRLEINSKGDMIRQSVRSMRIIDLASVDQQIKPPPLKDHGVYLITGGAGGLGLIFARYLAEKVRARLVLVGRSELNPVQQKEISAIESLGVPIHYIQTDISRYRDATALIQFVESQFQGIDGVIHAAGVISDGWLTKKSKADVEAVLAAKVFGTLNLDLATRHCNLDFFAMFSSITALTGNVGQCDYAFANGFMDHFAARREAIRVKGGRSGKTVAINWPLWQDGGMKVTAETQKLLAHTLGIEPLTSKLGWQAFLQGFALSESQYLVLMGDLPKLTLSMGLGTEPKPIMKLTQPENAKTKPHIPLRESIQRTLLSEISSFLKIEEKHLDLDEQFSNYGFDSITLTEFANGLNEKYELEVLPSDFFEYTTPITFVDFLESAYTPQFTRLVDAQADIAAVSLNTPKELDSANTIVARSKEEQVWDDSASTIKPQSFQAPAEEGVAIIGMSGMMPGATDLETFSANLFAGRELIGEIPRERWDWRSYAADSRTSGISWGAFMPEVDRFDALFFRISPAEAAAIDPQQRLLLESSWKAIEDAGYAPSALAGSRIGVFVGVSANDYAHLSPPDQTIEIYTSTGLAHSMLANRISYLLDLRGPSEVVDTACSSATVAIHRAVRAIQTGECECALAGAVNVLLNPSGFIAFDKAGVLSPDGKIRTFDKEASGYVRGEGVGVVLLKPLSRALADRDAIHGVILGSAVNHGGRSYSLTAPNPIGQSEVIVDAYRRAGIDHRTVNYIEAQGTATAIGDSVEINAFKHAFTTLDAFTTASSNEAVRCGIGSLKPNIGHLEAASGMAALFKLIYSFKYKTLPRVKNFCHLNPLISLKDSPFYILDNNQTWEPTTDQLGKAQPRRASLHSFGFGGTNAHLVLQEPPSVAPQKVLVGENPIQLVVLSAREESQLQDYASSLLIFLRERTEGLVPNSISLVDLAFTLGVGRDAMTARLAIMANTLEHVIEGLEAFLGESESVSGQKRLVTQSRRSEDWGDQVPFATLGSESVALMIREREWEKLAHFWVEGGIVSWNLLYNDEAVQKIHLPTYPFARNRHWLSAPCIAELSADREEVPSSKPLSASRSIATTSDANKYQRIETALMEGESAQEEERVLIKCLADLLGIPIHQLEPEQDLHLLGFNSLIAIQLKNRLMDIYGFQVPNEVLFLHRTIRQLVGYLLTQIGQKELGSNCHDEELESNQQTLDYNGSQAECVQYLLSETQKGMWAIAQAHLDNCAFNIPIAFIVTPKPEPRLLERALNQLAQRHSSLLATVVVGPDGPLQAIDSRRKICLHVVEKGPGSNQELESFLREIGREPIDLTVGPLVQAHLFSRPDGASILLLTLHHIIFDGSSLRTLLAELPLLYKAECLGKLAPLKPLKSSYADFVVWEQRMLAGEQGKTLHAYWKQTLVGPLPVLNLPTDFPRPAIQTLRGRVFLVEVPTSLTHQVESLSREEGVSTYTLWFSGFLILLHRYSHQEDLLVGTPMIGRPRTDFEEVIGNFANMVVIRVTLTGNSSFREFLCQVRQTVLEALDHGQYPLTAIASELDYPKDPSYPPLFQAAFTFQNRMPPENGNLHKLEPKQDRDGELELTPIEEIHPENARDLTMEIVEGLSQNQLFLKYNPDLFHDETIANISKHYFHIMESITRQPEQRLDQIDFALLKANRDLVQEPNDRMLNVAGRGMHQILEEIAKAHPDKIAVKLNACSVTYQTLNSEANQLAHHLRSVGVGPETVVGICLERSVDMIRSILAVLKAGGAFLVLNPNYPQARIALLVQDANVSVLLTQSSFRESLPASLPDDRVVLVCLDEMDQINHYPNENLRDQVNSSQLAYVIYTSGSTGQPKGVAISHGNLCHYVQALQHSLGLCESDVYLHTASFTFSSSIRQLFLPLCQGLPIVIADTEQIGEPRLLFELISREQVTIIDLVPSYMKLCLQVLKDLPTTQLNQVISNLRLVLSASEPLPASVAQEWMSLHKDIRIVNMFGQTETTGIVATYPVGTLGTEKIVPLGKPIANTQFYILDAHLQPVPPGVFGELYVGGMGVARGYLNRPDLTATRFLPNPFSQSDSSVLYKTGDIVRLLPSGDLGFSGRADHQLKIRGFRVEFEEIELALNQDPRIVRAVVTARQDQLGNNFLVAYLIIKQPEEITVAAIRETLAQRIPGYMIPTLFVQVETIPLTPSGKVDRKQLPELGRVMESDAVYQQCQTDNESKLMRIWCEVLRLDRVGMHDNFFEVGGDSLLSIQIVEQARKEGIFITARDIYYHQTIAELGRTAENCVLPNQ